MGIPASLSSGAEPSVTSSSTEDVSRNQPNRTTREARTSAATSLPNEALDLAAKLFDLARAGQTPVLMEYVAAGIPANMTNASGDTLIMLAAYHGHDQTVAALLDVGADPNCLNDRGQSPLAGAVFKGFEAVVRVLVEKGHANANAGQPTAIDTGHMFRRDECLRIMGVEGGSEGAQMLPGMIPRREL